jgi:hypothetical protein
MLNATQPVVFLRSLLLLPLIKNSAPARIVNVSSAGQQPIDFGDVMLTRPGSISTGCMRQERRPKPMIQMRVGSSRR